MGGEGGGECQSFLELPIWCVQSICDGKNDLQHIEVASMLVN